MVFYSEVTQVLISIVPAEDLVSTKCTEKLVKIAEIIGASLSEPHIDEFAVEFLYIIYIYIYISI